MRGAFVAATAATLAQADWKATTTYHNGPTASNVQSDPASKVTMMEKGKLRRTETTSPYVMIDRPDRSETILLDTQSRTYRRIAKSGAAAGATSEALAPVGD